MNLLAIETSSHACSVALQFNGKITANHVVAPMQQTNLLLPAIEELLSAAGATLAALDAIAYGAGPGSFTGMRIASSVTQGLAFAANLPVIAISSLAASAQAAHDIAPHQAYLVAIDARMGQVYYGYYLVNNTGCVVLAGEEALCAPADVRISGEKSADCVGAGDGWQTYGETLSQAIGFTPHRVVVDQLPTAEAVLKLALANFEQNKRISATEALPSYLIKR